MVPTKAERDFVREILNECCQFNGDALACSCFVTTNHITSKFHEGEREGEGGRESKQEQRPAEKRQSVTKICFRNQ